MFVFFSEYSIKLCPKHTACRNSKQSSVQILVWLDWVTARIRNEQDFGQTLVIVDLIIISLHCCIYTTQHVHNPLALIKVALFQILVSLLLPKNRHVHCICFNRKKYYECNQRGETARRSLSNDRLYCGMRNSVKETIKLTSVAKNIGLAVWREKREKQ